MFGKGKAKINPNTTDTLIGEGSVFEGRIRSQASLRVEGTVNGDIECVGDVTVGEHGVARSNITARNVTIAGKVYGNVTTGGILTITATGQLYGNSLSQSLVIAEGGIFQGQSKMQTDKPQHEEGDKSKEPVAGQTAYGNQTYNSSSAAI